MGLQDAWKRISLDTKGEPVKHVWDDYLAKEKTAYAGILRNKTSRLEGSVTDLAAELKLTPTLMFAFLDGINECVDGIPELETIEADTHVAFDIDFGRLYKQMVEYKADSLYTLPEWDGIFTQERQKELYKEQKSSHTIVRNEAKVGRNDNCPCGSGKKYKKCCGAA
ncbi:MAG: SEC-C metal-binding domain-containing protein [Defluviitaleaceae bacterium]|nr:SEC-C metal-binding domain-containing protein [Defluviitaleaceae bacterium]